MRKYFGQKIKSNQLCEVFSIKGFPIASILYSKKNFKSQPIVDELYLNKGLVLLFDAGDEMRYKLFQRYRYIDITTAKNYNDFHLF